MDAAKSQVQVFKMTRSYRGMLYVMLALAIALCAGGPVLWLILQPGMVPIQVPALLVGLGLAICASWGMSVVPRYRLEAGPDFIRRHGARSALELRTEDIMGFRILPGKSPRLVFIPKDKSHKKLTLSFIYERKAELLQWAGTHLVDLDKVDYDVDLEEIKSNPAFGSSAEERLARQASAKRWTLALTVVSVASMFWVTIYPNPYQYAIAWLAVLPVLALGLVIHFRGLIRLSGGKNSAYPSALLGFMMPIIGLVMSAFAAWHILDWSGFWSPFLLLGGCITAALLNFVPALRKGTAMMIGVPLGAFAYSYGLVIPANCYFDHSTPTTYLAKVLDEREVHGKSTSYYMTLAPFTDTIPMQEVRVSSSFYRQHSIGDPVHVYVRKGSLGISWFRLR
ncbi:MAG: hypothetical protein JF599_02165 [Verrucomicrobia bacterium]|nr:hypothetical protein [Verrucomicrobiota bacterium]